MNKALINFIFVAIVFSYSVAVKAKCTDSDFYNEFSNIINIEKSSAERTLSKLKILEPSICEDYNRYLLLSVIVQLSIEQEDIYQATHYSEMVISSLNSYVEDWNYGNAVHYVNTAFGLEAFNKGELADAGKYLLKSIDIPTTPQLKTFGPNFKLSKLLLKAGESNVVVEYLTKSITIWDLGRDKLENWILQINKGITPLMDK
jgi:hypothetical protein